jgi:hypothetical protein
MADDIVKAFSATPAECLLTLLAMCRFDGRSASVVNLPAQARLRSVCEWLSRRVASGLCGIALVAAGLTCFAATAGAQGAPGSSDIAQANNPLANFTAFNVHDYYIGELTSADKDANQFWARLAKPFSLGDTHWLMRASLPINTFPVPPAQNKETGVGDVNVFAAYLMDIGAPPVSFGVGPQITAPTATKDALGSGKWSAGLVNTLFNFGSAKFQYGYLLSWQASFAGSTTRNDVNLGAFQPFLFYQLGGGTYLRSTAVMAYDFENDAYSVPIGLGIG